MNNTVLNKNIKIAIVLILIFTLNLNLWASEALHNMGVPYLRYQKVWFLFLPGFYILGQALKNNRFIFRNGIVFIVFYILHYSFEHFAYGSSYIPDSPIDLLNRWMYIFLSFLFLVNTNKKYAFFILKTSVTIILIIFLLIYLNYFGLLNVSNISIGYGSNIGRLTSEQNLNIVNDQGVFAIYIVYWFKILGIPFRIFKKEIKPYYIIIFIIPLILLQASRGSFLLLLLGVILYLYYKWNIINIRTKLLTILLIPLAVILLSSKFQSFGNKIEVINRLKNTSISSRYAEEGRLFQVIASWENFKKSPVIGLGYQRAADNVFRGIYRSNFQYTQILASGGIILFFVYFYMVFKFFGYSFKLVRSNIIVFSIFSFVLLEFVFRRPEPYFAVMAYVVYSQSLCKTNNKVFKYTKKADQV